MQDSFYFWRYFFNAFFILSRLNFPKKFWIHTSYFLNLGFIVFLSYKISLIFDDHAKKAHKKAADGKTFSLKFCLTNLVRQALSAAFYFFTIGTSHPLGIARPVGVNSLSLDLLRLRVLLALRVHRHGGHHLLFVRGIHEGLLGGDLVHDLHALDDLAEGGVLAV